jgi:GDP-4-dehydro-6-deoxy-D-mannose reductase
MKNVLITGCSGFLGPFLIDRLGGGQENFCRYENITGITEIPGYTSPKIEVSIIDIRDRERIFGIIEKVKPEIVFHLAAVSNVGFSWNNQKLTYEINFIGSSNLLEAIKRFSPRCRVLLMSTAELYGGSDKDLMDESLPTSARNPYALSKKAMEMAADLYIQSEGMDIVKLRSFNFTGPGQDRKFVASDFSFQIAEIEKGKREPVIRVGNLSAVRDISDVRDIARFLAVIAANTKAEPCGIYNLCSGNAFSIRNILDILLSLSTERITVEVEENRFRPIDIPRLVGDNSLIGKTFHLHPEFKIEQTLSDLLNYWREKI